MKKKKNFRLYEKKLVKRFDAKIESYFFSDPKVVGWDTKKNQNLRFSRALKYLNLKIKKY